MSRALAETNKASTAEHRRNITRSIIFIIVAGIPLAILAFAAHTTPYFDFDLTIARAAQSITAPWFDLLMRAVGAPGYPPQVYVEVVAIFLILWFARARWEAIGHAFASAGIGAVGLLVKIPVGRHRPDPSLIHVANPNLDGGKMSFTAGHVESDVAILGFLMYLILRNRDRPWWQNVLLIIFGIQIALIGLSRIYIGEHWFSDVVGGYLLGAIWLIVTIRFYEWGKGRFFAK